MKNPDYTTVFTPSVSIIGSVDIEANDQRTLRVRLRFSPTSSLPSTDTDASNTVVSLGSGPNNIRGLV